MQETLYSWCEVHPVKLYLDSNQIYQVHQRTNYLTLQVLLLENLVADHINEMQLTCQACLKEESSKKLDVQSIAKAMPYYKFQSKK